jgi:hypothetical protein
MNPGLIFIRQLILPPFRLVPSSEKDGLSFRMDAPEQIMEEAAQGLFPFRRTRTMDGTPDGHTLL